MDEKQIEDKIKALGRLKQFKIKNLSYDELRKIAIEKLSKIVQEDVEQIIWSGLTENEEHYANKIFNSYIINHSIEGFNDKENLKTLVYNIILENQNEVCAICFKKDYTRKALAVDHDHENGKVRGLLCYRCNVGLGFFRDNEENLLNAIQYLKNSK